MNFGNVVAKPGTGGDGDHGGGRTTARKIECWRCRGDHTKRDFRNMPRKKNKKKDGEDADNKCTEVTGGQLHAMFMSSGEEPLEKDFRELVEDDELTWHQFHFKGWGEQEFEGHATVVMHNNTGRAVPLTWILLDSQSTVELISNPRMLLNIRRVRSKEAIRVH